MYEVDNEVDGSSVCKKRPSFTNKILYLMVII